MYVCAFACIVARIDHSAYRYGIYQGMKWAIYGFKQNDEMPVWHTVPDRPSSMRTVSHTDHCCAMSSSDDTIDYINDAQKKRSGREVRGVSPEAGRESMVGKICERGRS